MPTAFSSVLPAPLIEEMGEGVELENKGKPHNIIEILTERSES